LASVLGLGAHDPGLFALKSALRAAIVMPLAFALSLEVFGLKQMALFAAFGSMALLVFVDFAGPRRTRLLAYLALVAAGAVLTVVGTLCSRSPWLAAGMTALVAFAILYAGVVSEYIAAAHSAAMLTFVLPVMVPGSPAVIPTRLAGWGLAGALSIGAVLLLWPQRPRDALREAAARAMLALAELVEAIAGEDRAAAVPAQEQARETVLATRGRFLAIQHRPNGDASRSAALARLVDDLGWLRAIAMPAPTMPCAQTPFAAEREELEAAVPAALRSLAALVLLGELSHPDGTQSAARAALARVQRAHDALGASLIARAQHWQRELDETAATRELDEVYRIRQLSFATLRTGANALLASGEPAADDPLATRRAQLGVAGRVARTHASMRSAWLRNSVRGSAGLTLAVLIGQLSDLQHAFWIVLGTMSVLRSNALATGTTIVAALLGTLGGIVVGGALLVALGSDESALWAILPIAVLVAAYAPQAISFAAGQAGFSVVVLVLFNLIQPSGWRVGLVRVEDVAIGAAVSLLAGVLIWPRGAAAVLRESIGDAYVRTARYLDATIGALLGGDGGPPELAAGEAGAAGQLLEATAREYLSERSSPRSSMDDLTVLVAGVSRMRRVAGLLENAQTLTRLAPIDTRLRRLGRAREAFETERRGICTWYEQLGTAIAHAVAPPAPRTALAADATTPPARVVLERSPGASGVPPGLAIAWAHRHLRALAEFEPALARAGELLGQPGVNRGQAVGRGQPVGV